MTTPTAFPTWRTAWMALDGVQPLLAKADALLRFCAAAREATIFCQN